MGLHKEKPTETEPGVLLVSFNENVEIRFDEVEHTYTYINKKKQTQILKSASAFVQSYEDQFDGDRVSKMCSNKWGIDQEDILTLWDSNGKAASMFGTAMHAVMEHYHTHKGLGEEIQQAADKENNAALPNHPFLQQLIFGLDEIRVDGEAHQEALVSCVEKGICGLVDDLFIVNRKKKICRIRDYKFTYDILVDKKELKDPFGYLGSNKLAKYFLQLCFYGYLMQLKEWTVEGIDIYNWDGEWHLHTLEGKELMHTMVLIASKYV